jgi:hypothetical protein
VQRYGNPPLEKKLRPIEKSLYFIEVSALGMWMERYGTGTAKH